jgi:hypothetical protein
MIKWKLSFRKKLNYHMTWIQMFNTWVDKGRRGDPVRKMIKTIAQLAIYLGSSVDQAKRITMNRPTK